MTQPQLNNWDPLESNLSSEIVSATIKRQIKNILKSYTGWYDPFSELIQNALDAVEARRRKEENFEPKIWIRIDLKKNQLSVTDNGIGFAEDQFKSFLAPNVSFKKSQTRGNKGVGATYLAYGFNFVQIGTKTPEFSFIGSMKNGREWVEDESGTEIRPKIIQDSLAIHSAFEKIDKGSTFTLGFDGAHVRPKKLNWLSASNAQQWDAVLRIKTPLGGIYFGEACLLKSCELEVVDEMENLSTKTIEKPDYLYPHSVFSACKSLQEIIAKQTELISSGKDASKLPDSFYKLNGIFNTWDAAAFTATGMFKGQLPEKDLQLLKAYQVSCYGFFCYSTDVWDYFNDEVLKLRKGERILRGGLQLATNTMAQGDLLLIPLTRSIGYQNVSHVVVHFVGAEPDLGRKGFQPELEELAKRISVIVVRTFLNWRQHLKQETGAPPDIVEKKNIHDWIVAQEAHERDQPLIITRRDVFLPTMEPSITSTPLNEQDVVALFNQLLAGGVIRGVRLMAASQYKQYDSVARLILKQPLENHIFDATKNPLGVEGTSIKEFTSEPRILEYKYSFDALIEEFEKADKNESDIELVVVWKMGLKWETRYTVTPLLHYSNLHHRYFHGATHIVKNYATGDAVFPIIVLSELIDYINEPDAVQEYQHATYMS